MHDMIFANFCNNTPGLYRKGEAQAMERPSFYATVTHAQYRS